MEQLKQLVKAQVVFFLKLVGRVFSFITNSRIGMSYYNYLYERAPYLFVRFCERFVGIPSQDYIWKTQLVNGAIINSQIEKGNDKTKDFALAYKWHSRALNYTELLLLENQDIERPWIDVGANLGLRSLFSLSQKRPVYMFEPNPELNRINKQRCEMNNCINYLIIPSGISNIKGNSTFYIDETSYNSSLNKSISFNNVIIQEISIELNTLDNLTSELGINTMPAGIKIDVEGHEIEVLKGGVSFLKKWYPPLIVEVNMDSNNLQPFFAIMYELDYTLYQIKYFSINKYYEKLNFDSTGTTNLITSNDFLALKDKSLIELIKQYTI